MRRLTVFLCLAAFLALCVAAGPAAAKDSKMSDKKMRILMQWPEGDSMGQWVMTKHVTNLLDDLGQDKVELVVLSYGLATFAVTNDRPQTHFAGDIKAMSGRGVKFIQCHHAMDLLGVKDAELLPEVTTVQGAMSEISRRYHDGWQILRP